MSEPLADKAPAKLWLLRLGATLGCVALFLLTMGGSELLLRRSWQDFRDAGVRTQIFRHPFYDVDFIWSAVAFGANAVLVGSLFLFCFWMCWILIHNWDMGSGKPEK